MTAFRPGRTLFALALAVSAALAIAAAACGGGGKKADVEDWVDDVCAAFLDFDDATTDLAADLAEIDFEDPEEAKDILLEFLEGADKELAALRKEVSAAGVPDLKSGKDVVGVYNAVFDKTAKDIKSATKQVKDLNEKSRRFEDEVSKIFEDMEEQDILGELEDVADDEDDAEEVIDLVNDDEDCAAVMFDF